MLLSLLSKEEKSHFLDLLNELISADGKPTETELSIKNRLKYEDNYCEHDTSVRYRPFSIIH